MRIVVSDTSPLRALAHLELLRLVPELFDDVLIPPAVLTELEHPRPMFRPLMLTDLHGVRVVAPTDLSRVSEFRNRFELDPGESEALALAIEVSAIEVLMDEAAGRAVARHFGIMPIGVLGVLVSARKHGLVAAVAPLMHRLKQELNFYISAELWAAVLMQSGEQQP